jgi:hypothetical protein
LELAIGRGILARGRARGFGGRRLAVLVDVGERVVVGDSGGFEAAVGLEAPNRRLGVQVVLASAVELVAQLVEPVLQLADLAASIAELKGAFAALTAC